MKKTALITLIALLFMSIISNVPIAAADPSDWHINAGGADYTDGNGHLFVADKTYVAGDFGYTGNSRDFSFTSAIANTTDDVLYQTVRANVAFSYQFDIPAGDYDVTLHFMEPWQSAAGERLFDVTVEGALTLDDYDIYATAGGQYTAVTETFTVNVTDGTLDIDFARVSRVAMVSAITVEPSGPVILEPEITVTPTSLDFGDVVENTDSDMAVTITNDGTADLNVSSLTTTNGIFTVVSPIAPLVITPGNNEVVTVRFSPTGTGAQSGSLDIASDDADEATVSVTLDGNGIVAPPNEPDISVSPTSVDFGQTTTGGTADQIVTISNVGTQLLSVTALSSSNGVFTIVSPGTPVDVAAGADQDVTVRFSPTVDGVESGDLTISSNDPDEASVVVSLTGEGTSTPALANHINAGGTDYTDGNGDLFVTDKAYVGGDFGYSGNTRDFSFTDPIANTTDDTLYQTIRANRAFSYQFDVPAGDYDVTLYFIEPWQSAVGERVFDVLAEGVVVLDDYDIYAVAGATFTAVSETFTVNVTDGTLDIDFDRVNRTAMISAISVVSDGGIINPPTEPDISVSPMSVDFGQVLLGNTADQIVTITNSGAQTLTVSSLASSNGVFTIVSPGTPVDVLPNGGSEAVTVRFTPTVEAVENGGLDITSNDPDEGVVTVSLTGEGVTAAAATTYTNVTSAAGLSNSHVIDTSICQPTNNPPIGNGAAWADYDGDGDVDVYVTNQSGANWLYSNNGDGTFSDTASAAGVAASSHTSTGTVFIDYDNDGDQDLFVGGHNGNLVYENNGNGTFSDVTAASGLADGGRAMTAGWADFNNDGFLDVYLAKHKLCAGDDQQEDKLFVNDGDGTFSDVTTDYLCGGVAQCADVMGLGFVPGWNDYDNDGDQDIFLVNDDIGGAYQPTKLFRNDGSDGSGGWNFTEVAASADASYSLNGMGLGVGDYNNDGTLDLAFSHMGPAVLLSNDGDGTYTDQSSSTIIGSVTSGAGVTWGTAFFDHDNDGDLDLYFTSGSLGGGGLPNYFFDNSGGGNFTDASSATNLNDGGKARGLAIADFNDDGAIDVLVLNYGEVPALLENDGNSNNWLSVTVEGLESNRDAIGARITLTAGGVSQIREISSGSSHGGGDQRLALFGMGAETSGTLVIDWPNGETQNLGTVTAGQQLHFVEPTSTPSGATYEDVTTQIGISAVDTPGPGCGVPAGVGIAWGDYDNDGAVDVYINNHSGANYLYRNLGDTDADNLPNFSNVAAAAGVEEAGAESMSAVFIDYDNDGDQDLYVTNDNGNSLLENQLIESGSATFTDVTAVAGVADSGRAVTSAWADFNNDGFLDFYVAKHMPCANDNDDHLYMSNGDGTFSDATSYLCGGSASCAQVEGLGFSPAFFDFDNDGDMDLHLVNDDIGGNNYPNVLWRNDGTDGSGGWIFTDVSATSGMNVSLNGMGQGVGDYNNDGWLDVAYSNGSPGRIMENNGDGTFTDASATSNLTTIITDVTWGTVFFDYDNDGDQDLYFAAGEVAAQAGSVPNFMLNNNGDSTFSDISAASGLDDPGRGRSASIVDFDGDGFVDVMVGNYGGTYAFYRNDGAAQGNNNHWLTITVEGTESNRDAIGTRISVTAGGVTQIREINTGPTHGGGDYRAGFFGIGANTTATVDVLWPNGVTENLGSVSADQAMHLVEPASVAGDPDIDVAATLDFGNVETGTDRDKLVTITNAGGVTLTVSSIIVAGGEFTVESPTVFPVDIAPGGNVKATVRYSPSSDGVQNNDLDIASNDPDEATVTVAMTGTGTTASSTTYVDVAGIVGVDAAHSLSATCNPPIGSGSAWADYDNDGDIDLFVTNHGGANHLYESDGATLPNYTDVAVAMGLDDPTGVGHAAVFIDYDNDGDQDLYVGNWGYNNLYQNQLIETGSVSFVDIAVSAGLTDDGRVVTAAWGDFDQDGWLDLYIAKHAYCGGSDPRNADHLYHNNGDDTFTDVTSWLCNGCDAADGGLGFTAGWLDYDNDGDSDLYLVNDVLQGDGSGGSQNYHNVLWRNDGSDGSGGWNFTDVSSSAGVDKAVNGMGLGIGDYNNDGDLDLVFSDIGASTLYENNGNGTFNDVSNATRAGTGSLTWGTTFFDHDNDGWLDLFFISGLIGSGGSTPDIFLQNNGGVNFTDISVDSGLNNTGRGRNASVVDFDQDGLVDLFVNNYGGTPALYQNRVDTQGNNNHWLTVTVEGTDSNRDGIGTKMTLVTASTTQVRQIDTGSTHGGGDYRAAYFGLGSETSGTLTIEWPNGETEVIAITSDTQIHRVEPAAP